MASLDLSSDVADLTAALVDFESVSGAEAEVADAVESALSALPWLSLSRHGNSVIARTELDRAERVVVAGHLDTVPPNDNLPSKLMGGSLYGLGSCDMKGGVAVALVLAATLRAPTRDVTYVFYECEEVEAARNGLTQISASRPDLLAADLAVVMEPSNAVIEAGCQGSLTVDITVSGVRAHAARSWRGVNAIHAAREVLERVATYEPRRPLVDGLRFREGLTAVGVSGGVAGNVVPDSCTVRVNHRFAPDHGVAEAEAHLRHLFAGYDVELVDAAPGAPPGLAGPAARDFVAAAGGVVNPKFGWTDVARFAQLGTPAVNFGPGDPELAHSQAEHVPLGQLRSCLRRMATWLS
ncbi:MAG TPA: succinyl-diaminopimelate desuccinylase [Nocardioidaceae bacterium]|nr:succinyl-diaminopimelate desuccinylase [Nocardioidaceae bacterium]